MFIIVKFVKIRFKNGTAKLFSRGQKIKNITKIEQNKLFLFTFLVSFFGIFRANTDVHNKYIFNFVFGSFFEEDLLNLFVLGFYAKR